MMRFGSHVPLARRLLSQTAALFLLGACWGSSTGPDDSFEERSIVVTPTGGGVLTSADGGASVTIPPGAVTESTRITIRELSPEEVPSSIAVRSPVGRVWQLGPEGLQFDFLVEVRLAFDTEDLPPGVSEADLTMITIGLDGETEELEAVVVEGGASAGSGLQLSVVRNIRGLISHFSPFAIVVLDVHTFAHDETVGTGEPAIFDVEIRNRGAAPLTNVVLVDSLDRNFRDSGARVRPENITINTAAFPNAIVEIRPDSLSFTVDLGTLGPGQTSFVRAYTLAVTGRIPAQHCNLVFVRSAGVAIGEDSGCVFFGL